jgi:hypothetical protein
MEQLINVIGILGAYFAVLLVLAVAVESILDLVKLSGWLRGRITPEQAMKDISEWLPADAQNKAKVVAISNMVNEFKVQAAEVEKQVAAIKNFAIGTAKATGSETAASDFEHQLAVTLAAIRKKYEDEEGRRVAIVRILSAVCGIILAILLQIDTFQLLSDLFPGGFRQFITSPEYANTLHTGGSVLTGFAASAGSSFWHDQLDRIRAVKESARKDKEIRPQ